jgi:hypothetical protein
MNKPLIGAITVKRRTVIAAHAESVLRPTQ